MPHQSSEASVNIIVNAMAKIITHNARIKRSSIFRGELRQPKALTPEKSNLGEYEKFFDGFFARNCFNPCYA